MPTNTKKVYVLWLSEASRRRLYAENLPKAAEKAQAKLGYTPAGILQRVPLAPYFHGQYQDNRPDWLRGAHSWSVNDRKFRTEVILTNEQIAAILKLSQAHDIDPKPRVQSLTLPLKPRGVTSYFLSTFLDAVLSGYLIDTTPTRSIANDAT